jgi:mono/diheme cytochrome c family protein
MRLLLLLTATLMTSTVSAQTAAAPPPANAAAPRGNAENGKKTFVAYGCYQCHNYAANGGAAGPRLAPRPIPFLAFTKALREPRSEMPPYTAKVASDQALADIYAFLLTIQAPPAMNTIPLLND